MHYYVSIANVSDETLAFLGYLIVAEDVNTRIFSHFGTEIVVDRSDPFMYVDDLNDVYIIKDAGEIIGVPKDGH